MLFYEIDLYLKNDVLYVWIEENFNLECVVCLKCLYKNVKFYLFNSII